MKRMRFGHELRVQRESRGISLNEIAVSTRISQRHLAALEEDRFTELPGGVFNRGIVRSYAQVCGLDADNTVQNFLQAMRASGLPTEQKDDDWVEFAEAVQRGRTAGQPHRRLRWLGVLMMTLAVLLLAAGVAWVLRSRGMLHVPPRLHDLLKHTPEVDTRS